jgi:hypothetical protein
LEDIMIGFEGPDGDERGAPELREQVSAARDRVAELLLVIVGISAAVGLVTNLLATYVHEGVLTSGEWLALLAAAAATLLLALLALTRLRLTTRELDEEIEVAVPLLVPAANTALTADVIEISGYGAVTTLAHAAVAKLPPEGRADFALAARRIDRGAGGLGAAPALTLVPLGGGEEADDEENAPAPPSMPLPAAGISPHDPTLWLLQLLQVIVAAECLDESERLLGPGAIFHRGRWLRRRTPRLKDITWDDVTATAGAAQPFTRLRGLPGLRQRTTVPVPARILLTDVAAELARVKRAPAAALPLRRGAAPVQDRTDEAHLVPLLLLDAGRAGWLTISGVGRISSHAAPRSGQPAGGLTTRAFLRNARDPGLRRRALEEEAAAIARADEGVPRPGIRPPADNPLSAAGDPEGPTAQHVRAWRNLYRGAQRPRVARVYLGAQGRFRVRLSGRGSAADQALYAWAVALARRVGALDLEVFLSRLAERQQIVPSRRF